MTREQAINKYRLLDEKEFSDLTGISINQLRKMRRVGSTQGPSYIKEGRSVRYTLHLYERWLSENTVSTEDLKKTS